MTGYDDLLKLSADLGKASYEVTRRAQIVVRKTAADIEASGKRNAPVDTGHLRGSIGTTISMGGMSAEIGPTASYGAYVEFGTRRMSPPRPFMRPAADQHFPGFEDAVSRLSQDLLW